MDDIEEDYCYACGALLDDCMDGYGGLCDMCEEEEWERQEWERQEWERQQEDEE